MSDFVARAYDILVLRHPRLMLLALVAVLVFFGYFTKDFRLDASADSLLLEDDKDLAIFREIHERYPSGDLLIVTYAPNADLFSDESLGAIKSLGEALAEVDSVESVFTLLDAPLLKSSDQSFTEMLEDIPNLEKPFVDRAQARGELITSPIFSELIISADASTTALLLILQEDETFNALSRTRNELRAKRRGEGLTVEEAAALDKTEMDYVALRDVISEKRSADLVRIRTIIDGYRSGGELHLGGVPMITDDMVTYVRNDLVVFGGGVLAFLVVVLAIIFRSPLWIALPLVSCFYAGLVMIGLLGLTGWNVTVISSNFLALMLIITISMNIHLIVRFRQLKRDDPDVKTRDLARLTAHRMVRPCLYTALTTIIGFGSLVVSDIKPVIDFGWMMSAGLAVTFATSFLLFPTLLLVTRARWATPQPPASTRTDRFLLPAYLARLTREHGNKILVFAVAVTAVSAIGISQLRVENSFINYFNSETEIHQGLKMIDERLGGTTPLEVLIQFEDNTADFLAPEDLEGMSEYEIALEREFAETMARSPEYWFTPDKIDRIKEVHDYLDSLPEVGKVLSLASAVRVGEDVLGGELDSMLLALLYTQIPADIKANIIDPYLSIEHNEARLFARVLDSRPDIRRNELLQRIDRDMSEKLHFAEDEITVSGLLVLYNNMLQSLFSSQIKTIGVVMLGIAIMFLLLFRSIPLAIIGILPNVIGAAVVLGVMGWAGIPMDMMTITIAAITIGIAVDNGIHYIYRFREEYALSKDYAATLDLCHVTIGKAVFYTTLTIIVGFFILVFSNFNPTIYFGVLIAAAMFIALLAALTVLPKLILLWKPFR